MKSEPSVLRDFTVDRRVWLLSGVSIGIGSLRDGSGVSAATVYRAFDQFVLLPSLQRRAGFARGQPAGLLDGDRTGGGRADRRADGALRLRQDSWARDS